MLHEFFACAFRLLVFPTNVVGFHQQIAHRSGALRQARTNSFDPAPGLPGCGMVSLMRSAESTDPLETARVALARFAYCLVVTVYPVPVVRTRTVLLVAVEYTPSVKFAVSRNSYFGPVSAGFRRACRNPWAATESV